MATLAALDAPTRAESCCRLMVILSIVPFHVPRQKTKGPAVSGGACVRSVFGVRYSTPSEPDASGAAPELVKEGYQYRVIGAHVTATSPPASIRSGGFLRLSGPCGRIPKRRRRRCVHAPHEERSPPETPLQS